MRAKGLFYILGISSLSLISGSLNAQVGTSESSMSTSVKTLDDQNEQRLFDLKEQIKEAGVVVKREQRELKTAKANAREAKAALRAEKQAQKARKQANDQARKAEKALNR